MKPTSLPTLSIPLGNRARHLLRSGLVETLAAPHGVEGYLELIRPQWRPRDQRAELIAVRPQGTGSVTITLRPHERWSGFRAGQFVRLTVEIAGVRETRCYSPACAERSKDEIEITVKAHRDGKVSRYMNERAHPGMLVELSGGEGDFLLPRERPERLLLISSGSGITPVMSMLRTLCAEGHRGMVTFLHYARTPGETAYRSELDEIADRHANVRIALVFTRERVTGELAGHISREHLRRIAPDHHRAHTYVCGAPGLLAWTRAAWAEDEIERLLHVESFMGTSLAGGGGGTTDGSVGFARSRASTPNDGRSLLEQAERAGLQPPFGCRMGICRICTCRKTAGRVRNILSDEISSAPDEDIQLCVSVPLGDVELAL